MNPSISIVCDATFGAGSENFGTVTGNVTFQDGSANSGTVTGNAAFEGNAENKSGATVTGNATFEENSAINNGTVQGSVSIVGPFTTWLAANSGVNIYLGSGYKVGQWAYNQTEYVNNMSATAAQHDDQYPAWLASNVGVNQYYGTLGTYANQWAYNSTAYNSQAEAQAAYDAANQ